MGQQCRSVPGLPGGNHDDQGPARSVEHNHIQLHQILATKTTPDGDAHYPLRHEFGV